MDIMIPIPIEIDIILFCYRQSFPACGQILHKL